MSSSMIYMWLIYCSHISILNSILEDIMYLQILNEDDVASTNWNSNLLCNLFYQPMMIKVHNLLPPHTVLIS